MKAEYIRQLFQPFKTRLANILTRSKTVSVESSQPVYIVLSTVRGKPNPENIPMMQHFGFASVPPKNADQVRAHLSSDPDNPLIIASLDQSSQPTDLLEGDSALFDNRSQFIKIQADGIHIFSPDKDVKISNSNGIFELKADGSQKGSNSAGSFELKASGTVDLNGVTIDPSGNIVTPGTINADDVTADNQDVTLSTHLTPALNTPPTPGT